MKELYDHAINSAMNDNRAAFGRRIYFWIRVVALMSFILFVWIVSFAQLRGSSLLSLKFPELASLLFGASSLALFVFSIFIALLTIVGWQAMKDLIRERVETETSARIKNLELEMRGRTFSTLGYLLGEMSMSKVNEFEVENKERLAEAIVHCRRGYDCLEQVDALTRIGPKQPAIQAKYMVLNNLVYYSFLGNDRAQKGFLLEKARELMRVGQERSAMHMLLTACGVISLYGKDEEINEVLGILEIIAGSERQTRRNRAEAKNYLRLATERAAQKAEQGEGNAKPPEVAVPGQQAE